MKRNNIRDISFSAMFLAVAMVLPFLTGQIPEIGSMLLPMHIPVMLCGLICGARWGFAVGLVAPFARSLIFGSPKLFPMATAMAPELAVYGLVIGLVFKKFKSKSFAALYTSLICSMLAGRIVWGLAMTVFVGASGFSFAIFLADGFVKAVPGIILQLILIPSVMLLLRRARLLEDKANGKDRIIEDFTADDLRIPPDLLAHIYETSAGQDKFIIAIDGRCGSGKSTLAEALSKKLSAAVYHTDDFHLPSDMRTEERLSEAGGNLDRERFLSEILKPLSKMKSVRYRKYDCKTDSFLKAEKISFTKYSIIEGAYALHPELAPYYDIKVFYDVEKTLQLERITVREGEERAEEFKSKWIPLEEKYIEELKIIDSCDKIINAKN